jgi:uncharacterized protein HemY
MNHEQIKQLEDLVMQNPKNALMHYTLGVEYLRADENEKAITILRKAISLEPEYSAAYRELGKALLKSDLKKEATDIFDKGIAVAEEKGDIQTSKEMRIFLKRISK